MKQHNLEKYIQDLVAWNKVHRLIGNVSCETLLAESRKAIRRSQLDAYRLMVDVGAGAGILGAAWLDRSEHNKCLFLEPDNKAFSFLITAFSAPDMGAYLIKERLESAIKAAALIKQLIDSAAFKPSEIMLATRAFSASESLETLYDKSPLNSFPLYVFTTENNSFGMKKVR